MLPKRRRLHELGIWQNQILWKLFRTRLSSNPKRSWENECSFIYITNCEIISQKEKTLDGLVSLKYMMSVELRLSHQYLKQCVEVIAKEGQNLKELYLVSCKITDYDIEFRHQVFIYKPMHRKLLLAGGIEICFPVLQRYECLEVQALLLAHDEKRSQTPHGRSVELARDVSEVTVEQLVQQYPHITFSTVLQDCKRTLERAYQMGWTPNMSAASS
ncbi:hypothetical protein EI555_016713 [Monodon monoceros]|uniref:Uncharacterized protein n=1 Tax=Monodon monoceros TaxID=40151 RepID=A0A4U1FB08_MONMO|nr:hypothetical protein EI555_016713 [Monodon monoceros]